METPWVSPWLENWKGIIFRCLAGHPVRNFTQKPGNLRGIHSVGPAGLTAGPGWALRRARHGATSTLRFVVWIVKVFITSLGYHYEVWKYIYIYIYESRNWSECPPQSLDCFRFFTKAWSDFLFKSTAGQGRQHLDVSSCFSKANWSLLAVTYTGSMSANKNKRTNTSQAVRYVDI